LETSSSPIYQNGKVTGALTVWHSIDYNIKFKQAVTESIMIHRRINDYSPLAVITRKNGLLEYANPAALQLFGAKHLIDITGSNAYEFIHPDDIEKVQLRFAKLANGELSTGGTVKIKQLNGGIREADVMAVNISDDKNQIYQVFLRDITQEKKIEYYNNILNGIERELHSSLSSFEITQHAMEMAAQAIQSDSAAVSLLNQHEWVVNHVYKLSAPIGLKVPREEEPHALLALRKKKIILIEDAFKDPRANNPRLIQWGIHSVIVVPLFARKDSIGAIFFNFYKKTKLSL
ncbi:MAG: PAS domain S-box protein, partial [Bacteroidales bacterium]|nr:PAS domain S-box protein [Bacteroidales bacterium]